MAYAQNVLLSAGFEFEMLMWDVTNREQSMVLKGHKHPIVKVAITQIVKRWRHRFIAYPVSYSRIWARKVRAGGLRVSCCKLIQHGVVVYV